MDRHQFSNFWLSGFSPSRQLSLLINFLRHLFENNWRLSVDFWSFTFFTNFQRTHCNSIQAYKGRFAEPVSSSIVVIDAELPCGFSSQKVVASPLMNGIACFWYISGDLLRFRVSLYLRVVKFLSKFHVSCEPRSMYIK